MPPDAQTEADIEALEAEGVAEELQDRALIVDDEDGG